MGCASRPPGPRTGHACRKAITWGAVSHTDRCSHTIRGWEEQERWCPATSMQQRFSRRSRATPSSMTTSKILLMTSASLEMLRLPSPPPLPAQDAPSGTRPLSPSASNLSQDTRARSPPCPLPPSCPPPGPGTRWRARTPGLAPRGSDAAVSMILRWGCSNVRQAPLWGPTTQAWCYLGKFRSALLMWPPAQIENGMDQTCAC